MNVLLPNSLSLKKQIVDAHLMIGLGCILSGIVATVVLAWHDKLFDYLSLVVAVPLLILCVSTLQLRQKLKTFILIEKQLCRVASDSNWSLRPLRENSAATSGWNILTNSIEKSQREEVLADRFEKVLQRSGGGNWQEIFDACPEVLMVTNADLVFRNQNRAFTILLDERSISTDECLDMESFLKGLLGEDQTDNIAVAMRTECNSSIELQKSNELADGVWQLSRHAFNDPALAGSSLWILADITQRRLVEEARDQFVFTATHELRTPLANIRAYAETLAMSDGIDFEDQKGFINIINTEASRLARFIDDLLNISQMEVGAITIDRHETDVMRMLHDLKDNVQSLVDKKEQQFETKIPAKLPKLWIDKDKITSAITNLLSNANKYTPMGGQIRLIVEESQDQLDIHVEDTGYGISEEEIPKLTQKFFRSQDERVREETGSGIGLAFAHEVAKLHGGRISIRSELNKGSRFTLTLPMSLKRK